ncbi:MAG: hypothetical protein ISS10_01075 [Candidatus Marinimicrobia bacterium]|nr:hypothetical protein [Candidatus Neomarinimicrobiota bacterium]MBL7059571.1 hypothetical protein [Candidatus Neomarinimicrobiota bacterium]
MKKTVVIVLLLLCVQGLFASYSFYKCVRTTCANYHIDVDLRDMGFSGNHFLLTLNSMRNNFERVILIGYLAVGSAILKQNYLEDKNKDYEALNPSLITVRVNLPMGRNITVISTTATLKQIMDLSNGIVEPAAFMRKINMTAH